MKLRLPKNSHDSVQLHFRNTSVSNTVSLMRERCGFMSQPLREKTLSTGAEVAGVQNILESNGRIRRYCCQTLSKTKQLTIFLVSWQCHRKDRRKDFHTRTRTGLRWQGPRQGQGLESQGQGPGPGLKFCPWGLLKDKDKDKDNNTGCGCCWRRERNQSSQSIVELLHASFYRGNSGLRAAIQYICHTILLEQVPLTE